MTSTVRLPHFSHPPVYQVVLGVAFEPLLRLRASHVGLFWKDINRGDAYPLIDELTPSPVAIERFDDYDEDESFPGGFEVTVVGAERVPRIVLSNSDLSQQIAIQRDLLQVSWRRVGDVQYPRYEALKASFFDALSVFEKFLVNQDLGRLHLRQAEISYRNFIRLNRRNLQAHAEELVEFRLMHGEGMPTADDFHTYQRHTLEHGGAPWGRLYITFDSEGPEPTSSESRDRDSADSKLSFSILGPARSHDETVDFLDRAHDVILDAFVATITPRAQEHWGKLHGGQS